MNKLTKGLVLAAATTLAIGTSVSAQTPPDQPDGGVDTSALPAAPDSLAGLRLDSPVIANSPLVLDESLVGATGPVQLIVHLSRPSVAASGASTDSAQAAQTRSVKSQQAAFGRRVGRTGARVVGSTHHVLNAVFVDADATDLDAIAADPSVVRVAPVGNYSLDLSETVPYIGATTVQETGVTGEGVVVAVLDSGVDYTHANLGGAGTLEAYAEAYGAGPGDDAQTRRDGLFPTDKVIEGYDFVGEAWPNGDLDPDDDPIDYEGHGTHVSDIIAGSDGVAPGASILAAKVCSAVDSACSGVALIQAMDYAADPNGDGKTNDRVDVINMSLGTVYGQPFDDDLSAAVEGATQLGILTVASAGNSADKPYIVGTPSAAPSALSVAQTQVPSAGLQLIVVDGVEYPAVFQPWSTPPAGPISGPIQYADGVGGNLDGCGAFAPGSLAGLVVLVDRGGCNFTLKIKNINDAGGVVGLIGLVAPGGPFSGGDGGDRPITIPGYMISQADSNALKAQIGATALVDPANQLPLIGQMVGSSSRGPSNYYQQIKPEIGAPGASVSAIAGSGDGTGAFGGTSGAAPMVSGAAALLIDGFKTNQRSNGRGQGQAGRNALSPGQVKALLMNNAETDIDIDPFSGLAEITRIGGGEVRVDRAIAAPTAAWDDANPQAALSFGQHEVAAPMTLTRTVRVHNFSNRRQVYTVTPTFRFANDETGAVTLSAPAKVTVKPGLGRDTTFTVELTIDPTLLPSNQMSSGGDGADPATLTAMEFDGYLVLDNGAGHVMNIPWQVLPRKAAEVTSETTTFSVADGPDLVELTNSGAEIGQLDGYTLIAQNAEKPRGEYGAQNPSPNIKSVGVTTYFVSAGFCGPTDSFVWAFAVDTWRDQSHLVPVQHRVFLDIDQDGNADYAVYNSDLAGSAVSDGRQATFAQDLVTGDSSAFFFTEHATNTGNTVLLVCGDQLGLNVASGFGNDIDVAVEAYDFYFGGDSDVVDGIVVSPFGEQYLVAAEDIDPGTTSQIVVSASEFGNPNTTALGVMVFTNGDRGPGARGGSTDDTDTLVLTPG